jgi:GAF domain-containing protein
MKKHENTYHNKVIGMTSNPLMPNPDEIDKEFLAAADKILKDAAELARDLVGAHQSAIAIMVNGDFSTMRKYFSLSGKYAKWADYAVPATGSGTHAWLMKHPHVVRMTQAELEAHPAWQNFGTQAKSHPPMRGWLAVPIADSHGTVWGLLQLSDKYRGEFTKDDEASTTQLGLIVSSALEGWWNARNAKKAGSLAT